MDLDPLAAKAAAERNRFLDEHKPRRLRGQSDPTSYVSQRRRRKRSRTSCESACRGFATCPTWER